MAQHAKQTKVYTDQTGTRVELDPADQATKDRVARGELTEMTTGQNQDPNSTRQF